MTNSRFIGKTNMMILSMIPELEKGGKVAVIGCKDPKEITEKLKDKNIEVQSEPMFSTSTMKEIYNDEEIEEIVGIENPVKTQTGFLFYL